MKHFSRQRLLIPAGLFTLSAAIAVMRYAHLPDMAKGLLFGIGIGLLILSVILPQKKQAS